MTCRQAKVLPSSGITGAFRILAAANDNVPASIAAEWREALVAFVFAGLAQYAWADFLLSQIQSA
jgi:hypothetical protein